MNKTTKPLEIISTLALGLTLSACSPEYTNPNESLIIGPTELTNINLEPINAELAKGNFGSPSSSALLNKYLSNQIWELRSTNEVKAAKYVQEEAEEAKNPTIYYEAGTTIAMTNDEIKQKGKDFEESDKAKQINKNPNSSSNQNIGEMAKADFYNALYQIYFTLSPFKIQNNPEKPYWNDSETSQTQVDSKIETTTNLSIDSLSSKIEYNLHAINKQSKKVLKPVAGDKPLQLSNIKPNIPDAVSYFAADSSGDGGFISVKSKEVTNLRIEFEGSLLYLKHTYKDDFSGKVPLERMSLLDARHICEQVNYQTASNKNTPVTGKKDSEKLKCVFDQERIPLKEINFEKQLIASEKTLFAIFLIGCILIIIENYADHPISKKTYNLINKSRLQNFQRGKNDITSTDSKNNDRK